MFKTTWLSWYPCPMVCIYDQGGKFVRYHFQKMLERHGITLKPTTVKNPQSNSIFTRIHQTIGDSLRVLSTLYLPQGLAGTNQPVDMVIANTVYKTRCTYNST